MPSNDKRAVTGHTDEIARALLREAYECNDATLRAVATQLLIADEHGANPLAILAEGLRIACAQKRELFERYVQLVETRPRPAVIPARDRDE